MPTPCDAVLWLPDRSAQRAVGDGDLRLQRRRRPVRALDPSL